MNQYPNDFRSSTIINYFPEYIIQTQLMAAERQHIFESVITTVTNGHKKIELSFISKELTIDSKQKLCYELYTRFCNLQYKEYYTMSHEWKRWKPNKQHDIEFIRFKIMY
jgi:hypothetical protein